MISIIVPVYNVEAYVTQCLESIANQTYKDLDVIIVDDCGYDNSMSKVQYFLDNYSGPISFRVIHHECNKGLSAARNTGIDQACGEYISFIDSDDYISPNMYETLLHTINNQREDCRIISCCCYSDKTLWEDNSTRIIEPTMYAEEMLLMSIPHTAWGKLYHRSIISDVRFREGITNEDFLFHADLIDTIESTGSYMLVIPDKLYYYRHRDNSITSSLATPFIISVIENLELVSSSIKESRPQLYEDLTKIKARNIANFVIENRKTHCKYHHVLPVIMPRYKTIKMSDIWSTFPPKRVLLFLLIKHFAPLYCR